jgi:hypothetical protein
VLSFYRQKNCTIKKFQIKLKSTNSILKLVVKSFANYLFDIDSLVSTRCFISTAKTTLFLLISFTLVGLSIAPLSFINHSKFNSIISILQGVIFLWRSKTLDRSARAGKQLMIDTTLSMVKKHKNFPPRKKKTFTLVFKKLNDSLASHQDQKLERLQAIPRRLPNAIIQPKVTFVPGRKRALTGKEAADHQEKEEARERCQAQIQAEKQLQNNTWQA